MKKYILLLFFLLPFSAQAVDQADYTWVQTLYGSGDKESYSATSQLITSGTFSTYQYLCEYTATNNQTYIRRTTSNNGISVTSADTNPNSRYYIAGSELSSINESICESSAGQQANADNVSSAFPQAGQQNGSIYFETDADNNFQCVSLGVIGWTGANPDFEDCEIELDLPPDPNNPVLNIVLPVDTHYIVDTAECSGTPTTTCTYTYSIATTTIATSTPLFDLSPLNVFLILSFGLIIVSSFAMVTVRLL